MGAVDTWMEGGRAKTDTNFASDSGNSDEWGMRAGLNLSWSPEACDYVVEDDAPPVIPRLPPGGRRR